MVAFRSGISLYTLIQVFSPGGMRITGPGDDPLTTMSSRVSQAEDTCAMDILRT